MRLDRFDLNLLLALDALLDERNVTRAGRRLHLGQSAMSTSLRKLRDHFGDELLMPVGGRFERTPLGEALVNPVRETLQRARAAMNLQPSFKVEEVARRFTIYASDYISTVLLSHAVVELARKAPRFRLDIFRPPSRFADMSVKADSDLVILPEQYAPNPPHPRRQLFTDDHVCMLWSGHRLARKRKLSMDDYLDCGHIVVRIGDEASISFEEWFLPRYGRQREIECTVDYFNVLPLMLVGTERVATLTRRLAHLFAAQHPVVIRPAPFVGPPLSEVMAWPAYLDRDPAHQFLRATIIDSVDKMTP